MDFEVTDSAVHGCVCVCVCAGFLWNLWMISSMLLSLQLLSQFIAGTRFELFQRQSQLIRGELDK